MQFNIDYAHSLEGFSKCYEKHGHTAKIIIEVEGQVEGGDEFEENILLSFEELKTQCRTVLDKLDHKDLNKMFTHPTAERITKWIYNQLSEELPVSVARVTFFEGKRKWATIES